MTKEQEAVVAKRIQQRIDDAELGTHIYNEKCMPSGKGRPQWDYTCPVCGAPEDIPAEGMNSPKYRCGGQFTPKSQIQNHTDKWWGVCPVQKERVRVLHGVQCIACDERRLEGTGSPLTSFGWTCKACEHRNEPITATHESLIRAEKAMYLMSLKATKDEPMVMTSAMVDRISDSLRGLRKAIREERKAVRAEMTEPTTA